MFVREHPKKCCHCEPVRRLVWQSPRLSDYLLPPSFEGGGLPGGVAVALSSHSVPRRIRIFVLNRREKAIFSVEINELR